MQTATQQIRNIIFNNPCKIFSINDFENISKNKNTVKSILYRLAKNGQITRLLNGLYTKPYYIDVIDEYSTPSPDEVARKIAQKFNWTIAPGGEITLNYTGVFNQVPSEYVYVSDGPSRIYEYEGWAITFKHTDKKYIKGRSVQFIILIEAIKRLGKRNLRKPELERLALFARNIKEDLRNDTLDIATWIRNVLLQIKAINEY
ncbi:Uncharacterised protein [Mycoplasmopsis citelli]|uniref:Transcriptional regulator, AbiEi antitoxin, Type IV TA system n=1 Tax=Mycoplasmopsis citelli TaxID=171281 RepID=A0A449B1U1_9BACT|nr:DUF6088 family protein [Mycoplasmopsis citelli]VEU74570.1 Uncharacterised protein [Mycoplasmopsis citelli]